MKYRKKPVVIEAIRWTGANQSEIQQFCGDYAIFHVSNHCTFNLPLLFLRTLENVSNLFETSYGDYIIKGISGETMEKSSAEISQEIASRLASFPQWRDINWLEMQIKILTEILEKL
jgi:hypothetical protein